jgi:hypothetical protein
MNKREFLDILRQSLEGEVDNDTIEKNIRYYSDYISSQTDKSEEEVIESIGDPRLIAKTIIETEKISGEEDYREDYGRQYGYDGNADKGYYEAYTGDKKRTGGIGKIFSNIGRNRTFYLIVMFLIAFAFFCFLIQIGWFIIKYLFIFILPAILIALLLNIFRNNR